MTYIAILSGLLAFSILSHLLLSKKWTAWRQGILPDTRLLDNLATAILINYALVVVFPLVSLIAAYKLFNDSTLSVTLVGIGFVGFVLSWYRKHWLSKRGNTILATIYFQKPDMTFASAISIAEIYIDLECKYRGPMTMRTADLGLCLPDFLYIQEVMNEVDKFSKKPE